MKTCDLKTRSGDNGVNIKRENTKKIVFFVLYIMFMILTFIGIAFVFIKDGEVTAGYAIIPMVFCLVFGMLFRNCKKAVKENR